MFIQEGTCPLMKCDQCFMLNIVFVFLVLPIGGWNKEYNLGDMTCLIVDLSEHEKAKRLCQLCKLKQSTLRLFQQTVEIKMYQRRESVKGSREISKHWGCWALPWGQKKLEWTTEKGNGGRRKRLKEGDSGPLFCSSKNKILLNI